MSAEPLRRRVTVEEYLHLERSSETRNEYLAGEIFAMAGASRRHNLIAANIVATLHGQLRGRPCEVYPGDMRLHIPATGLYTYPDVTGICGEPRFEDAELDTLLNPTLIIEILSPSTEGYDRGKKFAHYRTIESLREVVLISQEDPRVESFSHEVGGHWVLSEAVQLADTVALASIGCELRLADVYERVFPQ